MNDHYFGRVCSVTLSVAKEQSFPPGSRMKKMGFISMLLPVVLSACMLLGPGLRGQTALQGVSFRIKVPMFGERMRYELRSTQNDKVIIEGRVTDVFSTDAHFDRVPPGSYYFTISSNKEHGDCVESVYLEVGSHTADQLLRLQLLGGGRTLDINWHLHSEALELIQKRSDVMMVVERFDGNMRLVPHYRLNLPTDWLVQFPTAVGYDMHPGQYRISLVSTSSGVIAVCPIKITEASLDEGRITISTLVR